VRSSRVPSHALLSRALGWSALAALAVDAWWGLWVSPPDVVQGQFVRMLYVHPAVATMCYAGFGLCAVASIAWLWPRLRSPRWDRLAVAGAEVGAVFCAATLITGSIWGRASWGVWWTWDARLTLTAILFALSLGYLALRRAIATPSARATVSSMVALLMALTVVVDHYATDWFVTLHQGETLPVPSPTVHGWQLATMLESFVAFGLLFAWLVVHRYRMETLEERYDAGAYTLALRSRRSEGGSVAAGLTVAAKHTTPAVVLPGAGAGAGAGTGTGTGTLGGAAASSVSAQRTVEVPAR